jgi:hypothetical protein
MLFAAAGALQVENFLHNAILAFLERRDYGFAMR